MKMKPILLFCISLMLVSFCGTAQETNTPVADSLKKTNKYGLRIGADLSKPLRTLLEDGYTGFEIVGDFRVSKRFYAAAEVGNEEKELIESNLSTRSSGSYAKLVEILMPITTG